MFYNHFRNAVAPMIRLFYGIRVEGLEHLPQTGGAVLCANHVTMADPLLLAGVIDRTLYFLAKKELFSVFGLGWLVRKLNAIPVDRGNRDVNAVKEAMRVLRNGEILVVFPEGTRNPHDDPRITAKAGAAMLAAKNGCPVLPVAIVGTPRLFGHAIIRFCPPILLDKEQYGKLDHQEYKQLSMNIMKTIREARDQ